MLTLNDSKIGIFTASINIYKYIFIPFPISVLIRFHRRSQKQKTGLSRLSSHLMREMFETCEYFYSVASVFNFCNSFGRLLLHVVNMYKTEFTPAVYAMSF